MTERCWDVRRSNAQTILSAGRALFLTNGYQGTSVDQIAASAEVSKQTVYKHFGDKQELLLAIVNDALDSTVTPFLDRIAALADTDRSGSRPHRHWPGTTCARCCWSRSCSCAGLWSAKPTGCPRLRSCTTNRRQSRTLAAFAECFGTLHDRGLLHAPEPAIAAEHFAFLIVGRCIDQALFYGGPQVLASIDVERHARAGVQVFLAGYRPRTPPIDDRLPGGRRGRPARRGASARRVRVADDDGSAVVDERPRRRAPDADLPDARQRRHRRARAPEPPGCSPATSR